jgi:hypothetical protein
MGPQKNVSYEVQPTNGHEGVNQSKEIQNCQKPAAGYMI